MDAPIALELHGNGSESVAASTGAISEAGPKIELSTILVPVDFSEGSRKAVRYAGALAAQFGAAVAVACIVAPVVALEVMAAFGLAESDDDDADKCEAKLREMARDELGDSIKTEFEVVVGEPSREIIRLARELDTDLIVMSTHGYTGFKRALFGSTAERVMRQAPCPVLVLREHEKGFCDAESQAAALAAGSRATVWPVTPQARADSKP